MIAGVLGAYWARETLSMAFFYPHVSPSTQRMIAVSCVYHWAKIALVPPRGMPYRGTSLIRNRPTLGPYQ